MLCAQGTVLLLSLIYRALVALSEGVPILRPCECTTQVRSIVTAASCTLRCRAAVPCTASLGTEDIHCLIEGRQIHWLGLSQGCLIRSGS